MNFNEDTRGLWLRTRYREGQYDGEACLLVYDEESFSDLLVSGDVKQVFERRAGTANIFILAPFLSDDRCRTELKPGLLVRRAASYMSAKSGKIYLLETVIPASGQQIEVVARPLIWNDATEEVDFGETKALDPELREGWLFDLFDRSEGLVVAPPGVHFRKSSSKHANKFLRAANTLTSSNACGLLAFFALAYLGKVQPKRILVDTAPLLALAFSFVRVARARGVFELDAPARSFSSYGGQRSVGRLSKRDILMVSATTSGSLAQALIDQGANPDSIVTLYFLSSGEQRPPNVLCDLTISGEKSFGYQLVQSHSANACPLCIADHLLAEFEGDQFLLQQRQHRLLRFVKSTQTDEARRTLTELYKSEAMSVVLRPDVASAPSLSIDPSRLLRSGSVRKDLVRLLRRYCPQPLGLVVRVDLSSEDLSSLFAEAEVSQAVQGARIIDWSQLSAEPPLAKGVAVLVIFGCLGSHTRARQINASLRSILNEGNVSYLSALTLASTPEQYQDLKMFLGYGERGVDTFTFRDARRLGLGACVAEDNAWSQELALLDSLVGSTSEEKLKLRRQFLATEVLGRNGIYLDGKDGPLAIQRDFVYLDTTVGTAGISQADTFAVLSNLFAVARANDRSLLDKAKPGAMLELAQSVYGHVLLSPESFMTFNDAVLKAGLLRAARMSELRYEVEAGYSVRMGEIINAELDAWGTGAGDALPEMVLAMAMRKLRLRDVERVAFKRRAMDAGLPSDLATLVAAISD